MKPLTLLIAFAFLSVCAFSQNCPTTSNCGCSNEKKADCIVNSCCQWIVGTGCKCASESTEVKKLEISSIIISPNPFNNVFNLQFFAVKSSPVTLEVVSVEGKTVLCQKLNNIKPGYNQKKIDLPEIPRGVYICRLNNGTNVNVTKLVKE
jgi:hypothetical protein